MVDTNSCCPNDVDSNLMETIKHSIFWGALARQLLMVVDKNYAIRKITKQSINRLRTKLIRGYFASPKMNDVCN